MEIAINGATTTDISLHLTHKGQTIDCVLVPIPGGWKLLGESISRSGFHIGNHNTTWPNALAQAMEFMREKLMREFA